MTIYDLFIYSGAATIILGLINFCGMSYSCGDCGDKWCPIGWWNAFAPILFIINGALFFVTAGCGVALIYFAYYGGVL